MVVYADKGVLDFKLGKVGSSDIRAYAPAYFYTPEQLEILAQLRESREAVKVVNRGGRECNGQLEYFSMPGVFSIGPTWITPRLGDRVFSTSGIDYFL